jgi:hypothetical protein
MEMNWPITLGPRTGPTGGRLSLNARLGEARRSTRNGEGDQASYRTAGEAGIGVGIQIKMCFEGSLPRLPRSIMGSASPPNRSHNTDTAS